MLSILKDGYYQPITAIEFQDFAKDYPELSRLFSNTPTEDASKMNELVIGNYNENDPICDCWDKAAKKLLSNLMRHQHAWFLSEPVDYVKLNILDYPDIIT